MPKPLVFVILDAGAAQLGLTCPEKSTLIALASHLNAKRNGTEVWPANARLADLTGLSESSVRRALQKLHALQLIKIRSDNGKSNTYTIDAGVIHSLADPCHSDTPKPADPCHTDTTTPVSLTGDPCHSDTRTAKEQPIRTAGLSNLGCSRILGVAENPEQRRMPLAGVVARAADAMRPDYQEQPTENKNKRRAG